MARGHRTDSRRFKRGSEKLIGGHHGAWHDFDWEGRTERIVKQCRDLATRGDVEDFSAGEPVRLELLERRPIRLMTSLSRAAEWACCFGSKILVGANGTRELI